MRLQNNRTATRMGATLDEREEAEKALANNILDFYLSRYPEVYVVICNKCKEKLALEIKDNANINREHRHGRTVIELSNKYGSHRSRLDGTEGYQCRCGNDNRWAYVEWQVVHHGGSILPPHEIAMIEDHLKSTNHAPDVKIKGKDTIIENKFIVRQLK